MKKPWPKEQLIEFATKNAGKVCSGKRHFMSDLRVGKVFGYSKESGDILLESPDSSEFNWERLLAHYVVFYKPQNKSFQLVNCDLAVKLTQHEVMALVDEVVGWKP